MILLAVFDLDGTLLDTIEDLADSVNYALQQYDLPAIEYGHYKKLVGKGALNLCEVALKTSMDLRGELSFASSDSDFGINKERQTPCTQDILNLFRKKYESAMYPKTKPYAGIEHQLDLLQNKGVMLAVISNKPDKNTKELILQHFPKILFKYIIGDSEAFPRKPNPDSLKFIMDKLNVTAEQTAFLGDSDTDMITAVSAKTTPIGVLWGFRDEEELVNAGAKIILNNPAEIYPILTGRL